MSLFRKIEHWAKDNPIKLAVLSYPIAELTKFTIDSIKGVNYFSLLSSLITFLNVDFNVKTWHVLLLGLLIIISTILRGKWKKNKTGNNKHSSTTSAMEGSDIRVATHPYNSSLTSQFLSTESGTFSIWAYVTDIHNQIHPSSKNLYLVSYATNRGNESNNQTLARYPNAWAIQRIPPSSSDNGLWRFWCNNIEKKSTHLDYTGILSGGWHLFTVTWSTTDNYIKFIIDEKIVSESQFENWPSDFSASVILGTWPTRSPDHYFNSKIGPWRFTPSGYNSKSIKEFFTNKPRD